MQHKLIKQEGNGEVCLAFHRRVQTLFSKQELFFLEARKQRKILKKQWLLLVTEEDSRQPHFTSIKQLIRNYRR